MHTLGSCRWPRPGRPLSFPFRLGKRRATGQGSNLRGGDGQSAGRRGSRRNARPPTQPTRQASCAHRAAPGSDAYGRRGPAPARRPLSPTTRPLPPEVWLRASGPGRASGAGRASGSLSGGVRRSREVPAVRGQWLQSPPAGFGLPASGCSPRVTSGVGGPPGFGLPTRMAARGLSEPSRRHPEVAPRRAGRKGRRRRRHRDLGVAGGRARSRGPGGVLLTPGAGRRGGLTAVRGGRALRPTPGAPSPLGVVCRGGGWSVGGECSTPLSRAPALRGRSAGVGAVCGVDPPPHSSGAPSSAGASPPPHCRAGPSPRASIWASHRTSLRFLRPLVDARPVVGGGWQALCQVLCAVTPAVLTPSCRPAV